MAARAARAANPAIGGSDILVEGHAVGTAPVAYCSSVRADGNGPVDPEGPEAHRIDLATL